MNAEQTSQAVSAAEKRLKRADTITHLRQSNCFYMQSGGCFLDYISRNSDPGMYEKVKQHIAGWDVTEKNRFRTIYRKPRTQKLGATNGR